MSCMDDNRRPVIVGVGEITDRPADERLGLEPRRLMAAAVRAAQADAGAALLGSVDRLDVVMQVSWSYTDLPQLLAQDLGLSPQAKRVQGPLGGETPVAMLAEAAAAIARGECRMAVICGGEAARTQAWAEAAHHTLDWTPRPAGEPGFLWTDFVSPLAARYGLVRPLQVYPLYENAARAAWGQSLAEAQAESGRVWAAMSQVAQDNPHAWRAQALTPEAITTASPRNRPLCHPYLKWMVAQPTVNQSAAVIVTSVAQARALGVPETRWVHVWSGAGAHEPDDFLVRDRYDRSLAMQTALAQGLAANGLQAADVDLFELYSCFPIVPKLARRFLGLAEQQPVTVTGGLPFFGAPLNNYMGHAAAAMVRALRAGHGRRGLLYGNGGYVSKHQTLVLATEAAAQPVCNVDAQAQADAAMEPCPPLLTDYTGPAVLETCTAEYDREGRIEHGTVLARTPQGARVLARVPGQDVATLDFLVNGLQEPVGHSGQITGGEQGLLHWQR